MPPTSSRRMYGSLEDPIKPQRSSHERFPFDASADRPPSDIDPLRPKRDGGARVRSIAFVGIVAVGVMVGLSGAGYGLSGSTSSSVAVNSGTSGGQSLIDVSDRASADRKEAAAVRRPSSQEFPKIVPPHSHQEGGVLSPLDFTALNPYHVRDGKPAADYPWLKDVKLIEPFRETTLSVTSPREGFEYRWVVRGHAPDQVERRVEAVGEEAVVVCTVLEENIVTLEEVDAETGVVARRLEEEVMVKYVRREIRTLTDEEREELLDAVRLVCGDKKTERDYVRVLWMSCLVLLLNDLSADGVFSPRRFLGALCAIRSETSRFVLYLACEHRPNLAFRSWVV